MKDLYSNWARVYDYAFPDRSDEVAFWAGLAKPCGLRLLDLMCGTAEVSLGLAWAGFHVLGLDRSPAMLAVGAERLDAAACPDWSLSLAQGDARTIPACDAQLDFVLVGGSGSFNHLASHEAFTTLGEVARVLRPGGGFGMELVNPFLLPELPSERIVGPLRPTPPGVWVETRISNRYDRKAGRFHIQQATEVRLGGCRDTFEESFSLFVWAPEEVRGWLVKAGFGDVRLYGGYRMESFDRWSPDLVVVASLPPSPIV